MIQSLPPYTAEKRLLHFVFFITAIAGVLLLYHFIAPSLSFAHAPHNEMMGPPPSPPLQQILTQLDLTEEQQSAVQSIIETDMEKHRALMEAYPPESRPDRDSIKSALDAIDQEIDGLLAEVLTAEQRKQLVTLRKDWKVKFPPPGSEPRGDFGREPMHLPQ